MRLEDRELFAQVRLGVDATPLARHAVAGELPHRERDLGRHVLDEQYAQCLGHDQLPASGSRFMTTQ